MKLVYFTAQKYPSKKADPFYRLNMARAFSRALGGNFTFVVRGEAPADFAALNPLPVRAPRRAMALWYAIRFPFLAARHGWNNADTVLLSYDPYLTIIAIMWRRLFRAYYSACHSCNYDGYYRVVFDWHQLFEDWRDRWIASGADAHMTTSKRLKRLLSERYGVLSSRVATAYGGVDTRPFEEVCCIPRGELRSRLALPEGFLVGYVGGFTAVGLPKGLDIMIRALRNLPSDMRMVFVGGNEGEIREYRALAAREGVVDRCVFVRRQPFNAVVEYERAMDVLVIPYPDRPHFREWGFPMKVWEYMAAGRPVVYSDLELMGEILEGRARAFTPDDPVALARAVIDMRDHWSEVEHTADENRHAVRAYTWDARARAMLAYIKT